MTDLPYTTLRWFKRSARLTQEIQEGKRPGDKALVCVGVPDNAQGGEGYQVWGDSRGIRRKPGMVGARSLLNVPTKDWEEVPNPFGTVIILGPVELEEGTGQEGPACPSETSPTW